MLLQRSTEMAMPRHQTGATLLEGLIAMLLMGLMGMGMTFILSRAALSQSSLNAQNSVVNQLRGQLQSTSGGVSSGSTLCTAAPNITLITGVALTNTTTCSLATVAVSVAGAPTESTQVAQIVSSVTDNNTLGGTLVMKNSSQ